MMSRIIITISILLVFCIGFIRCSKDEVDDSPETTGRDIPVAWKMGEAADAEDVMLTTSDDIRIAARYRPAAGNAEKVPVFICIPMATRTKSDYDEFTERLSEIGVASLALDLRGHGDSRMDGRIRFSRFTEKEWNDCIRDIYAAIGWLAAKDEIDSRLVGILGASVGANLAIKAGTKPEIRLIVALSPGEDFRGVNITEDVQKISNKPVYVAASDGDEYSFEAANKMAMVMDELVFVKIIEDSSHHGTEMLRIPFFTEDLIRWIKDTLNEIIQSNL